MSDPVGFLETVLRLLEEGSYLYLELPDDLDAQLKATAHSRTIKWKIKHAVKSLIPRGLLPQKPYLRGPLMHEHINNFTISSLCELVRISGLECVDIGKTLLDFGCDKLGILYCLARKPHSQAGL
jgi:hypothetical protein